MQKHRDTLHYERDQGSIMATHCFWSLSPPLYLSLSLSICAFLGKTNTLHTTHYTRHMAHNTLHDARYTLQAKAIER